MLSGVAVPSASQRSLPVMRNVLGAQSKALIMAEPNIGVRPMPVAAQQAVVRKHYVSTWSRRCSSSRTA